MKKHRGIKIVFLVIAAVLVAGLAQKGRMTADYSQLYLRKIIR